MTETLRSNSITVHPDETPVITANFTKPLTTGVERWISSVASPASIDGLLTITGETVNSSVVEESNGNEISPSKSVTFQVADGLVASTTHYVKLVLTLTENSEKKVGIVPIVVTANDGS